MSRYHVSQDGVARKCTAQSPQSCTATSSDLEEHYDTKEEAQKAYEEKSQTFSSLIKKKVVEPGTMAPQEPIVKYSITAKVEKTIGPDEIITFDYKNLEEAQTALTSDPRLRNRPSSEKIDLSLSKTTEIIEYFEPEELEPEDETQFSTHNYAVHNTKFLNGRLFGLGSQGRTLPQSKAKELFEQTKKQMAESPYPEVVPYNPDTQTGTVIKIGRKKRVSEPIDINAD